MSELSNSVDIANYDNEAYAPSEGTEAEELWMADYNEDKDYIGSPIMEAEGSNMPSVIPYKEDTDYFRLNLVITHLTKKELVDLRQKLDYAYKDRMSLGESVDKQSPKAMAQYAKLMKAAAEQYYSPFTTTSVSWTVVGGGGGAGYVSTSSEGMNNGPASDVSINPITAGQPPTEPSNPNQDLPLLQPF